MSRSNVEVDGVVASRACLQLQWSLVVVSGTATAAKEQSERA